MGVIEGYIKHILVYKKIEKGIYKLEFCDIIIVVEMILKHFCNVNVKFVT